MKNRVGEIFSNNKGQKLEIIEYFGSNYCTVKFEDNTIVKNIQYDNIKRGKIENPNSISLDGVGYIGVGKYSSSINGLKTKSYKTWTGMIARCYNRSTQLRRPEYTNCSVDPIWHNYQNFAEWFELNYIDGYSLDKDILFKGNKVYGPNTCVFVPNDINALFNKRQNRRGNYPIGVNPNKKGNRFTVELSINAKKVRVGTFDTVKEAFNSYKTVKEKYIKEIANKWKNKISTNTYNAMINYKIEITD